MSDIYSALMKHKKKGGKGEMDEKDMHAKMGVLKDIHDMASGDLGHDLHGLKKVSVMSDSDEGMKEGLQHAKAMADMKVGKSNIDAEADESNESMHPEARRHKTANHAETSDEQDGMEDVHGDLHKKGPKAMEGYAAGGDVTPGAEEEEANEEDDNTTSAKQHSIADAMQKGTHGTKASPDDEYAELDPQEIEALISHLQKYRKSSSSF